jgi:hypothetical protein
MTSPTRPVRRLRERGRAGLDPGFHYVERRRYYALDPGFHCVRTQWIRGFMAFQLARRSRTVMLMVPV